MVVDDSDDELVRIAARLLRDDFALVTDKTPRLLNHSDDSPPKIAVGDPRKKDTCDQ